MTKIDNKSFINSIENHINQFFELHGNDSPESGLHERIISEVERILIKKTIEHTNNVHSKAAQILGINRNTLRKKINTLNIKL